LYLIYDLTRVHNRYTFISMDQSPYSKVNNS